MLLGDHVWYLKSYDLNGKGVVKIYCAECKNNIGGTSRDHSKTGIANLFTNYKKSHVMSTNYVKNFCNGKGIKFTNHPQSIKDSTRVILTQADHKKTIGEGAQIVHEINDRMEGNKKPFHVVGDPNNDDLCMYWFEVQCNYCNELFQLCLPRKNLASSLTSHLESVKHMGKVTESLSKVPTLLY